MNNTAPAVSAAMLASAIGNAAGELWTKIAAPVAPDFGGPQVTTLITMACAFIVAHLMAKHIS
jgi:hypothetical protein